MLQNGYGPLHVAAFHGNELAIEVLLEYGADIDMEDQVCMYACMYACMYVCKK